jgi:hypothetical protein
MKIIFLSVLTAFSFATVAQVNPEKVSYQIKIEKYKRMKTSGLLMIVAGSAMTVLGISKLIKDPYTSSTYSNGSSSTTTINQNGVEGELLFLGGSGLLGAGIPLAIIGSKKSKQYQRRYDALTLNLDPEQKGLTLSCKF